MKKSIKIFIIIGIIGAILITGYFIWRYFVSSSQFTTLPKTTSSAVSGSQETTPINGLGLTKINQVSNQTIFAYWLKPTGEIYFLTQEGTIYQISATGKENKVTGQVIQNINQVKPSADGSKAIISFGYPIKETFTIFNTLDKSWTPLPTDTIAADWHPNDNNQIAILKNNALSIYNLANKTTKEILKINQKDLIISWITPDEIYLMERPAAELTGSLWLVNLTKETIRPIIKDEFGLMIRWFPKSGFGLKFTSTGLRGGNLTLIDKEGRDIAPILNVTTLPSKCVANKDNLYCAASPDFKTTKLPDDFLKGKNFSSDNIYFILRGLENRSFAIYNRDIEPMDINAVNLQIKENRLIFINRLDNKLYSINLPF